MKTNKNQTFEGSLKELENIVRGLEEGDLPLEESLKLFEDGIRLSRECQKRLDQAERRIEILLEGDDGEPVLQEIEPEDLREQNRSSKKRIIFGEDDGSSN